MPETAVRLTALIVENPLCLSCVAKKLRMSAPAVEMALGIIDRALPIQRDSEACRGCGRVGCVYVLKRPNIIGGAR
jgi:hypothetical protein